MDHGIETPDIRVANGKPEAGTVKLSAYHSAGSVVVEIEDDGKGLDKDVILAKGVERGLVPEGAGLKDPTLYFNKELSWIDFNWRVLHLALDERVPLLERVKFVAITAGNLDDAETLLTFDLDGKLLLVTNTKDLDAQQVVDRYKALADIERGFRVLKSEIEIGPVYHRLPQRIRAHAYLCFIALIIHRVMRARLRAAESRLSPERALETLRRIQRHRITLNQESHTGISTLSQDQSAILQSLNVSRPTEAKQLTLL